MPPPLLPEWVVPAALLGWALVSAHVRLIRQGRLRGHSIFTHFGATMALASSVFIEFYVPVRWHGGAKFVFIVACYLLSALLMAITKKLPAAPAPRRWRKATKHDQDQPPQQRI